MSYQRIRSIEVDDGFLQGVSIEFVDHLNCLIGSRGAGKTTLLEFLRYALRIETAKPKIQTKLLARNLKAGTIRVALETAKGQLYTIERRRGADPVVLNDAGEVLSVAPEGVLDTAAYVYSQSEIQDMAETPTDRLALLDRFAEEELKEVNREITRVTRELEGSANRLLGMTEELSDLQALREDLARAEEERRSLTSVHDLTSHHFEQETARKALRGTETRALEGMGSGLQTSSETVAELSGGFLEGLNAWVDSEIKTGPNADVFAELSEALAAQRQAALLTLEVLKGHVEDAEAARVAAVAKLAQRHHAQDADYDAHLKKHKEASEAATVILEADERIAKLKSRIQEQTTRRQGFDREATTRRDLLKRLSELRDQRTQVRQQVVKRLNTDLKATGIEIRLGEQADLDGFSQALLTAFRGSRLPQQQQVLARIAANVTPFEFASFVTQDRAENLAEIAQITRSQAQRVVSHLADSRSLYTLEAQDVEDVASIWFSDGEEVKPTDELSTGQKFTAILPILLLQSDQPLICDEPESHLDQRTLVQKVVTPIEALVGKRQLIFATHNANLVVLGDAGNTQVVVLESDGRNATVAASGTVDDTKEAIGSLLEGGAKAFRERAQRYGKPYER